MNIGIIILCRYDSTRLPGKILKKIGAKTVLEYIYDRLSLVTGAQSIIVATSNEKNDDKIAEFCSNNDIKCYRGVNENVANRILTCAQENRFDYFIRINGDNVFPDAVLIDEMVDIAIEGGYDFISNVKGRTFPIGMCVEILKTAFYKNIVGKFDDPSHFEHVTLYLYENGALDNAFFFMNEACPQASGLRLALDNEEDFVFLNSIVRKMRKPHTEYSFKEMYELSKC